MPIFEYRCEECGNRFDAFFRRAEEAEEKSPACGRCGSSRVKRLFSVIGLGGSEKLSRADACGTRST